MKAFELDVYLGRLDGQYEARGRVSADTLDEALKMMRELVPSLGAGEVLCTYPAGSPPPTELQRERALLTAGLGLVGKQAYAKMLSKVEHEAVRRACANGEDVNAIARRHSISRQHVKAIARGMRYKPRG